MKKLYICFLCLALVFSLCACGSDDTAPGSSATETAEKTETETENVKIIKGDAPVYGDDVEVDLTKLSSTMVYSEVYNMMNSPGDYMNKVVKMNGAFAVYTDDATQKNYFAVINKDATACCSQGIEFTLAQARQYPDDYPMLGTDITVTGIFGVYYEGDNMYCQLTDAVMSVNS